MSFRGLLLLLILVVAIGGGALLWPRLEGTPPTIEAPGEVVLGKAGATLSVAFADGESGLRSVSARIVSPSDADPPPSVSLIDKLYAGEFLGGAAPGGARAERFELSLDPKALNLADGSAELVLSVQDWSWRGNSSERRVPLHIDTRAPRLSVDSGLTYVRRGGSAAVLYRVDADSTQDGVRVGDAVFRGYPHGEAGGRAAIVAVPVEAPADVTALVFARDAAGNESTEAVAARVLERSFPNETIALSSRFLDSVPPRLAERNGIEDSDPVAVFDRVNTELRARNEARIREIVSRSGARRWHGRFEQMANSSVTSLFAEFRSYTVGGLEVSQARHYGFDLASTARAAITASNAGVVIHADDLGIYGNTVILDHGLGVTTLYAHLSSIGVDVGDEVVRGQELGRSGATGLAGGDHLHFAVLVGDTYVDPVEWWDAKWVREHVEVRIGE